MSTTYQVIVKPGSKQEKVVVGALTLAHDPSHSTLTAIPATPQITIYTHARAHDNAANQAVIQLLAKHFHTSKSCVTILRGHHTKVKTIQIA